MLSIYSVAMSELPHFSSTALADKFAVSEHLDYVYYLRRGQPSFAFANFVATKLVGHSNTTKRYGRESPIIVGKRMSCDWQF